MLAKNELSEVDEEMLVGGDAAKSGHFLCIFGIVVFQYVLHAFISIIANQL